MLTECDALLHCQLDAKRTKKKVESGPTIAELDRYVIVKLLRHIKRFDVPAAHEAALSAVKEQRVVRTFSEDLAAKMLSAFERSMPHLSPEQCRSLALYLAGVPPQTPGYLHHVISFLGESAGEEAVRRCVGRIWARINRLYEQDRVLLQDQISQLPRTKQRIIKGHLLDAQWCFEAEDGINSALHVKMARELATTWVNEISQTPGE